MTKKFKVGISARNNPEGMKINGKGRIEIGEANIEGSASCNIPEKYLSEKIRKKDIGTFDLDVDSEKIDLTYKLPSGIRKAASAILGVTTAAALTTNSAVDIYRSVGIPIAVGLTVAICAYKLLGRKITLYQRDSPLK